MKPILYLIALAIAGCSADAPKQDISEPHFEIGDDKDDSPRKPSKGSDVRITQLVTEKFTASRGYISHEIQLDAGTVDIDVTGDGAPLDTILYVFGPKRANGTFPARAIAFNDDFDYPENLGSHIVLDVTASGAYRIVVSTYDNYVAYPTNVSRETYRLMVKCRDAAFGACGPAISDLGGDCWADDDCMALDGRPLHCEGEVTCAPGTNCFFTRMGKCVADYAYMTYAPKQCSNPWSSAMATTTFPVPELGKVVAHYKKLGIQLDEIGRLARPEPVAVCTSCGCARGDEIVVKLSTPMAEKLAAQGWIYSSSNPPEQSLAPAQCGTNPWQTSATTSVDDELELVDTWLAANEVTPVKRGFAWPVEPLATCSACSCPRGDRLMVYAPDLQAHGILQSLGFDAIYVP
jgi:hypothetical protein